MSYLGEWAEKESSLPGELGGGESGIDSIVEFNIAAPFEGRRGESGGPEEAGLDGGKVVWEGNRANCC